MESCVLTTPFVPNFRFVCGSILPSSPEQPIKTTETGANAQWHSFANVFHATGFSPASIRLELEIDALSLALDKAIPCGLILNELITNALKHAFPHERSGMIRVELRKVMDDQGILLAVVDDGVGMPSDLKPNRSASLGMQLVSTLVDQLDGNLEIVRRAGTAFRVTFPLGEASVALGGRPPAMAASGSIGR